MVEFAIVVPIMVVLLVAIVDFARIYTTIVTIESAAREAADYGTTLGAGKWQDGAPKDATVAEMQRRACVASLNLPDYSDPDNDPATGCTNPSFSDKLSVDEGGTWVDYSPTLGCEVPTREPPCWVKVTLTYDFRLFAPIRFEILGASIGLPESITVQRDSLYAMTDIDVATTPPP